MIFLIVKDKKNDVVSKNLFTQINTESMESIRQIVLKINPNYKISKFIDLNNNSVISLESESKYFKPEFIKKLEELVIIKDFDNLEMFENYIMYIFEQGDRTHIAFKGFESNIRIKRSKPKLTFSRNPEKKEIVDVHYKSEDDISLPIDWDFKYVIDNYDDKQNKFYINQLESINNFLIEPLENIRIKNFKLFEKILNKNGYFFKKDINGEEKYEAYMKYIPLWRHPDIEEIIKDIYFIISETNKLLLSELFLLEQNTKELHMTKIKHTIALLVGKIWKDDKGVWRAADTSEIIEIPKHIEKENNKLPLMLVVSNNT